MAVATRPLSTGTRRWAADVTHNFSSILSADNAQRTNHATVVYIHEILWFTVSL